MRYSAKHRSTPGSLRLLTCLAAMGLAVALSACATAASTSAFAIRQAGSPSVVSSPVRVAHTSLGTVDHRVVGSAAVGTGHDRAVVPVLRRGRADVCVW